MMPKQMRYGRTRNHIPLLNLVLGGALPVQTAARTERYVFRIMKKKSRLAIRAGWLFSKQSIPGTDSALPASSTVTLCPAVSPELGLSSLSGWMLTRIARDLVQLLGP